MTVQTDQSGRDETPVPEGYVKLTMDGEEVVAPQNELIIRTAERVGTVIPRFCDHPLLEPAGACRQCLVEVEMNGRAMPKPQASCTITVADGMVVRTQRTSEAADKAQQGVMELLLINHPLDCPVCDKGGECPLQNQAMAHGRADSRFVEMKRTFPKPLAISSQILLDRERCVQCQRCTRFSEQIAGDPFIDLLERGARQEIGTAATARVHDDTDASTTAHGEPFNSYFSGNTIQICPVGALTSAAYRFRSRPFDLVSTPSVCEHCASGCEQRTDHRRGKVMRKLAGDDPEVNEEWLCDKGRFAFRYAAAADRVRRPMVRDGETGRLRETSWTEALTVAAEGLRSARDAGGVGVLPGGRLTTEDSYAYSKFARMALGTNDIDFRARAHSTEELDFLGNHVVGGSPENGVTYGDIEVAPTVLCAAFEPEEESPIVFLRLRKAARQNGTHVVHLGQWSTPAIRKTSGELVACVPGGEAAEVAAIPQQRPELERRLTDPGAVILVGERAAEVPGLLSALHRLSVRTGARIAWVPRRAGERGALRAGALPTMLPGEHAVSDAAARAEIERVWAMDPNSLPAAAGRDTDTILEAVREGELSGLLLGGLELDDLPDPALARDALSRAGFVVTLELRAGQTCDYSDVVLPVAPSDEKSGSYLTWEGRRRPFETTLSATGALPDCRVLDTLAVEMDVDIFLQTPEAAATELASLAPAVAAERPDVVGSASAASAVFAVPDEPSVHPATPGKYHAVLATWRQLLDNGSLQDDEPHLAGTARPVVARLSRATAVRVHPGGTDDQNAPVPERITVSTERGSVTLPVELTDLPDGVVWLPANSDGSRVRADLGTGHGALVSISRGES